MNKPLMLLCCLLAPHAASANLLAEIYQLAQRSDPTYAAARADYRAALEARPQLRAQILPQLSFSASLTDQEEETVDTNPASFAMPGDVSEGEVMRADLTLIQPIFDWAIYNRLAQIDEQVALAEIGLRDADQQLIVRVVSAYFDWLSAVDTLRFAGAEKSAIGQQLEQARSRFEVGLSAITDVQEAQARYDLAVAQEIEAASTLRSAREAMTEITGELSVEPVPLAKDFRVNLPTPADPDDWVRRATESNLALKSSELSTTIAKSVVRESYGGHLPSLSFRGNYGILDTTEFPGGRETETTSYTLQLDVPLFAGGASQSLVRQRRSEYERSLADLDRTRRATVRSARDRYDGVVTGASRVRALTQAVKSSTTALEAVQAGFNVGSRTGVDVLNAQRELYRAQRDLARARYDYVLSLLTLKQAVGALSPEDLAQVDNMLATAN